MPKLPGVNHLDAVRALEKAGFRIVTILRHNPVNAFTMAGIVRDAGLNIEASEKLV